MYYIYLYLFFHVSPMLNAITKYFVFAKFHFLFNPQACFLLFLCVCLCKYVCVCVPVCVCVCVCKFS